MQIRTGVIALALLTAACGAQTQGPESAIQRSNLDTTQQSQYQTLIQEGDAAWEGRVDRAQLETAIQKWEQAIALKDDDWQTYAKLTRAYYFLADGWLAFDEARKPEYLAAHEKGFNYAERGLAALSPEFEKRVRLGGSIEDAVALVGKDGVPLIYWYASNIGKWANATSFTKVLENKERIFQMVSRVHELDQAFFYGASHRYFGAFYAIAPPFAGGDLEKSMYHFNESKKRAPDYLGTYNLIAEYYAPKAQDPAVFDEAIAKVLETPVDVIPELVPESTIEKKKAEALKAKKAELF